MSLVRGQRKPVSFLDVHYTRSFYRRVLQSLSEPVRHIVICSPYFDKLPTPWRTIEDFCNMQMNRGVEIIQIITRPPGADRSAMTLATASTLVRNDVQVFIWMKPYLHAKLYHFEYHKGYFTSFVGSSNFTLGGFERNHEVIAEVEGIGDDSPCHREIRRLLDSGGTLSYQAWLAREMPKGTEGTV